MGRHISGFDYINPALEAVSPRQAQDGLFPCPCCAALSFAEAGGWEICDICGWEDDPMQEADREATGGANGVSLVQAREFYREAGVSSPHVLQIRRKPRLP